MIYIVDIFRDIVEKVSTNLTEQLQSADGNITGVHYLTGHYTEIKERLASKSNSITQKLDRYPLVCLFQDFVERKGLQSGYYCEATLQLMIVHHTRKEAYNEDRYNNVFRPILYPIYTELISQIASNVNFIVKSEDAILHDKIDRPHWGNPAAYGNNGYLLNDVLDGIELRNLKITVQSIKTGCNSLKN
jgi:hypothetical protein